MLRATPGKLEEREKIQSDYEQWLAAGNEPTTLPGFGLRSGEHGLPMFNDSKPKLTPSSAKRYAKMGGEASAKARKKQTGY